MLERGYCYKLNINSRQMVIKEYNRSAQKKGLPPASMCDVFAIFEEKKRPGALYAGFGALCACMC